MSKADYINAVELCEIKEIRVKEIEKKYAAELNPVAKKIISYADSVDFFDEERRALSYLEILDPEKNIGFNFVKQGLVPFVDLYDNSYAVFNVRTCDWGRFNTVDGVLYRRRTLMEEIL